MTKDSGALTGSRERSQSPLSPPTGFDPERVRRLLDAVAPLCLVVADYATHPGPHHEPQDRILGRIGRGGEIPPYLTWEQVCEIEDAAYEAARHTNASEFALDAIAMETREGEDVQQASSRSDDSAGLKDIAQPEGPTP